MKVRSDFVTNSSSSSFILARKGNLSEAQKAAIIEFVEKQLLGRQIITTDSTEEEIQKVLEDYYISEENQEKIENALKTGKSIYNGWVCFEDGGDTLAQLFISLWEKLENADAENFEVIDGSLDY